MDSTGKRFLKSKCDLSYDWFDFFKIYNADEAELLAYMQKLGIQYLQDVKPTVLDFSDLSSKSVEASLTQPIVFSQKGILRVNCVDCLDRTNNAMACISSVILPEMLRNIGVDFSDLFSPTTKAVTNELLQITLNMFAV